MSTNPLRLRLCAATAALVLLAPAAVRVAARQSVPDVRGTYPISGVLATFGCMGNTTGVQPFATPFDGFLVIVDQDGDAVTGNIAFRDIDNVALTFTGHVSSDGTITGDWSFVGSENDYTIDRVFAGGIDGTKAAIDLTGTFVYPQGTCQYRTSGSSKGGALSWTAPDLNAVEAFPPPRALTFGPKAAGARTDPPTGYNVYRSGQPGVQPVPENLFTSVPATQTTAPAASQLGGSFFVVTAVYEGGESGPSNEVTGGIPAATLRTVKVSSTKIKATGTDFSAHVQVFVDGIPFAAPAKVKNGAKVTQKGALITGQSLDQYITSGKTVSIAFRNDNGGIAAYSYTKP